MTVIVTSKFDAPIMPNVQNTAQSVGRPAMITTLIPWIGRIPEIPA